MPEWLMQLLIAGGGLGLIAGGVKSIYNSRNDERKAEIIRREVERAALEARVEKLQDKIESLLMDAIAREQEANAQMQERIAMDAKQNEVIAAATVALKDAAAAIAKLEMKP